MSIDGGPRADVKKKKAPVTGAVAARTWRAVTLGGGEKRGGVRVGVKETVWASLGHHSVSLSRSAATGHSVFLPPTSSPRSTQSLMCELRARHAYKDGEPQTSTHPQQTTGLVLVWPHVHPIPYRSYASQPPLHILASTPTSSCARCWCARM